MRLPPLAGVTAAEFPHPTSQRPARHPLLGAWSATRWQYTAAADPSRSTDLVTDQRSVVLLGLSSEAWVLTFDIPGLGSRSAGGTYAADGGLLVLNTMETRVLLRYRLSEETLSLSDASSGWDFDGDGADEPASLVAVFVRV